MLSGFAISSVAIFLAELGDKSQLMAMTFAARYRAWRVLLGIALATAVMHAASVALGFGVGSLLPTEWLGLAAGIAFIGFAGWTLRGDELSDSEKEAVTRKRGSALLAITVAFLLAELGDKTMLATVTLATEHDWFGTWAGSTVGMVLADALAVGFGFFLGKYVSERIVRYGAAVLFAGFGTWLSVGAVLGLL